jgi:hypothetical protein
MHFLRGLVCVGLVAAAGAACVQAQSTLIGGPVLGFTPAGAGSAITPIIGIPGASILTDPLVVDGTLQGVTIAPKQDYAVAVRTDDAQMVVVDLGSSLVTAVGSVSPQAFLVGISPRGSAVAVYDGGTGVVRVIGGQLPQAPAVVAEFDASGISGAPGTVAVSDDGTVVLMRAVDSDGAAGLWVVPGGVRRLPVDQPSGVAFFAGRHDVVIGDDATSSALMIQDVGQTETEIPLVASVDGMAGFSNVAASADGTRVFLADGKSGNVAVVDLATGTPVVMGCGCQVTGFSRLRGSEVFRLNDATKDAISVLDASGVEPRIVMVPPSVSLVQGAQ